MVDEMEKSVANDLGGSCNVQPRSPKKAPRDTLLVPKGFNLPGSALNPLTLPAFYAPCTTTTRSQRKNFRLVHHFQVSLFSSLKANNFLSYHVIITYRY